MAAMADVTENAVLDHTLGTAAMVAPTNVYVALFTTTTTDAAGGTEVPNLNAYARTLATFSAAAVGSATNAADIIFPAATGNWGTATHIAIIDAAGYGLGNWLYHGALTASKIVNLG
ncbi:MAG: hypothetical protein R8M45_07495, partial [Ghiorsea sp.]